MEANLEIKENQNEYHAANTFPQVKQENVVPQENLYHTQNIFDKQELFETKILSQDQNEVNNNAQNSQVKSEEVKETSYTFDGMDNIFSNMNQSSSLKGTNLDLYIKNSQNSQNIETSNNKISFGEVKPENSNSNNIQNTFEGPETNYTFDANIFKTNENTAPEVDYKFDADIFQKNPDVGYNDNENIYISSENNNDNNLNINEYNYNLGENQNLISTEENNINLQNDYNTDYINNNNENINYSETLPMEYLPEKVDTTNNNDNINLEMNFDVDINKLTFGQQVLEPLLENNNQPDFIESQNIYQHYITEEPKIENEINNQNFDNILTSNQNEDLMNINDNNIINNDNIIDNNINNDNIIDNNINNTNEPKLSAFDGIQEAKTLLIPNNELNDINNNINSEQIEKEEKEEKKEVEPIPEINKEEYHEEEINTNLNNNEENKNEIQLNTNNTDNIEQDNNLVNSKKESLPEENKKEENKLVDISDEIKEIKDMPESPYEQRDVIFNKNNIKVIKIEDDETHFCSDLFSPLFKKIFG